MKEANGLEEKEMLRMFNCGIGMVVIVGVADVEAALSLFKANGD
jgi:phosphoribosylformylglycinamidine cyclo-ligase